MCSTIHAFEQAGLGKAPFRYIGMEHQDISYGQRVVGHAGGCPIMTKPGGTCDYCGTYIVNIFTVESADGNRFKVGCECVRKTGDAGLVRNVDRDVKEMERKRRQEKAKAKRIAEAKATQDAIESLPRVSGILAGIPHPIPAHAAEGRTTLDYVQWLLGYGMRDKAGRVIIQSTKGTT